MKINIGQKEIIHFIGIGGIGMSGLAQIMKIMGFKVQGSDVNFNKNIEKLQKIRNKKFLVREKKYKERNYISKIICHKNNNLEIKEAKKENYQFTRKSKC